MSALKVDISIVTTHFIDLPSLSTSLCGGYLHRLRRLHLILRSSLLMMVRLMIHWQKSVNLVLTNPRIKVVELSRNFGHHKAMMTAVEHASGSPDFLE